MLVRGHAVSQVRWAILEQINSVRGGNLNQQLLKKEAVWIKRMDSLSPQGLNESFILKCFLYILQFL
ncbi:hypothetical protein XELAEV_18005965mg [Xenopus laevis]|uniref:Uncharacterized protein n=1 Tax=Xenopus laevis TaxID=8355 RepID=A0A974I3N3_XENLA|nr:hypothetical protein XELAEV_18005965mg [Xenopus laevis]